MPNYHCRLQCKNIAYQVQNIDMKPKYLLKTMQQKKQTSANFKAKDTKAKPIRCKPKANVHLKDYE
jgi:hypothetical protein